MINTTRSVENKNMRQYEAKRGGKVKREIKKTGCGVAVKLPE
jgi:hypothetical protein